MPSSTTGLTRQEHLLREYHSSAAAHMAYMMPALLNPDKLTPYTLFPRVRGLFRVALDLPHDYRPRLEPVYATLLRARPTVPQTLASLAGIMDSLANTLCQMGRLIEAGETRFMAAQLRCWADDEEERAVKALESSVGGVGLD